MGLSNSGRHRVYQLGTRKVSAMYGGVILFCLLSISLLQGEANLLEESGHEDAGLGYWVGSGVEKRSRKISLCGEQLMNMMNIVCGGRFGGSLMTSALFDDMAQDMTVKKRATDEFGLSPHHQRLGFAKMVSKRGLANECCRAACSFNTLTSYCSKEMHLMITFFMKIFSSEWLNSERTNCLSEIYCLIRLSQWKIARITRITPYSMRYGHCIWQPFMH